MSSDALRSGESPPKLCDGRRETLGYVRVGLMMTMIRIVVCTWFVFTYLSDGTCMPAQTCKGVRLGWYPVFDDDGCGFRCA